MKNIILVALALTIGTTNVLAMTKEAFIEQKNAIDRMIADKIGTVEFDKTLTRDQKQTIADSLAELQLQLFDIDNNNEAEERLADFRKTVLDRIKDKKGAQLLQNVNNAQIPLQQYKPVQQPEGIREDRLGDLEIEEMIAKGGLQGQQQQKKVKKDEEQLSQSQQQIHPRIASDATIQRRIGERENSIMQDIANTFQEIAALSDGSGHEHLVLDDLKVILSKLRSSQQKDQNQKDQNQKKSPHKDNDDNDKGNGAGGLAS